MKTIILYATKYGATAEIARRLGEQLGGAVLHDLKQSVPDLSGFDRIIIGSSVYAGSIRKEAKNFMTKNADLLTKKPLGLFLSSLSGEGDFFDKNFPAHVLQHAKAKVALGGIFEPAKAGGFERFIMKKVMKTAGRIDKIDDEKIKGFAEQMMT